MIMARTMNVWSRILPTTWWGLKCTKPSLNQGQRQVFAWYQRQGVGEIAQNVSLSDIRSTLMFCNFRYFLKCSIDFWTKWKVKITAYFSSKSMDWRFTNASCERSIINFIKDTQPYKWWRHTSGIKFSGRRHSSDRPVVYEQLWKYCLADIIIIKHRLFIKRFQEQKQTCPVPNLSHLFSHVNHTCFNPEIFTCDHARILTCKLGWNCAKYGGLKNFTPENFRPENFTSK